MIANTPRHRPWMSAAGWVTAALGAALLLAQVATSLSILWPVLALIIGALIEVVVGFRLAARGGAGTSHVIGGTMVLASAAFLTSVSLVYPEAGGAGPIALMLGISCICNGLFRGGEVPISRPRAWRSELLDAGVSLALGVFLLLDWQQVTASTIALVAGIDLLIGGLAMVGSSGVWAKHPELAAYDDWQERITHGPLHH
jgi:uncharacterized membrane protein HdeD (DUF308 family)